jgi:hypothetical protein
MVYPRNIDFKLSIALIHMVHYGLIYSYGALWSECDFLGVTTAETHILGTNCIKPYAVGELSKANIGG